jgi:secreted trypsin-like serine protease
MYGKSLLCALAALTAMHPAHAIVNGSPDPAVPGSPFAPVASVTSGTALFSAVLLTPEFALTAAHAVDPANARTYTVNLNVDGPLSSRIGVSEIFVAPGYAGFDPAAWPDGYVRNDLALLRLAAPAPLDVPALAFADLAAGQELALVGYGATESAPTSASERRVGTTAVAALAATPGVAPPRNDVFTFDYAPGGTGATLAGGDSGGPAYARVGDTYRLAGINTFVIESGIPGAAGLGVGGGGMVLSAYRPWIESVIAVPEPGAALALAAGLAMLAFARRVRAQPVGPQRRQ